MHSSSPSDLNNSHALKRRSHVCVARLGARRWLAGQGGGGCTYANSVGWILLCIFNTVPRTDLDALRLTLKKQSLYLNRNRRILQITIFYTQQTHMFACKPLCPWRPSLVCEPSLSSRPEKLDRNVVLESITYSKLTENETMNSFQQCLPREWIVIELLPHPH